MPELKTDINSKDLLLLFLYFAEDNCIYGKTRVQKMVFLFEKEIWDDFKFDKFISKEQLPSFEPYDFGPFTTEIYSDLDFLESLGYIKINEVNPEENSTESASETETFLRETELDIPDSFIKEHKENEFCLEELGKQFVERKILAKLNINQKDILEEFVKRCTEVTLNALVKYVYVNYPKYAEESHIKHLKYSPVAQELDFDNLEKMLG